MTSDELMCTVVGRGAALAAGRGRRRGADAQARRHAQLRRRGRAAELRLPRQHHVRADPPDRPALLAAGEVRRQGLPEGRARSGAELDGGARRHDLHLQAPQRASSSTTARRSPPRTSRPATSASSIRRRAWSRSARPTTPISARRGARPDDGRVQAEEPDGRRARGAGLALQLHLQRRQAQAEPALSRDRDHGHGRLHASSSTSRARAGTASASTGYFDKGKPYLDGYKAFFVKSNARGARHPRRPVRRRVPRPQPVGEGPAARQDEGQPDGASRAPGSTT